MPGGARTATDAMCVESLAGLSEVKGLKSSSRVAGRVQCGVLKWAIARCMVARSARLLPSLSSPVLAAANEVFQTVSSEQLQLRRPLLPFPRLRSGRAGKVAFPVAGDPDKCNLQSVLDVVVQVYMGWKKEPQQTV